MQLEILFFGITSDLIGKRSVKMEFEEGIHLEELKKSLLKKFPKLKHHSNFSMAVNMEYAQEVVVLKNNDIVALIPPVSGG
ncbi:MAG: molybdopterin converting factor subunit 1 [Candidatus Azotimanducaceae bacterium]|jgi:molybdopterin converting factor subunit 1